MRSAALTGRGSSRRHAYHNPKPQTGASSPGGYFQTFFEKKQAKRCEIAMK
jgi:hypothetical protein